jgi:hypothetical protein
VSIEAAWVVAWEGDAQQWRLNTLKLQTTHLDPDDQREIAEEARNGRVS